MCYYNSWGISLQCFVKIITITKGDLLMYQDKLFTFVYILNLLMISINLYLSYKYDEKKDDDKVDKTLK